MKLLYYDMIHRKKKSFLDLKLKILKDKEEGKISTHIYYELMNDVVLAEKENKQYGKKSLIPIETAA